MGRGGADGESGTKEQRLQMKSHKKCKQARVTARAKAGMVLVTADQVWNL